MSLEDIWGKSSLVRGNSPCAGSVLEMSEDQQGGQHGWSGRSEGSKRRR